ncbi:MAG: M23 family metallopeptidase [Bryobacteraceae bacterium]
MIRLTLSAIAIAVAVPALAQTVNSAPIRSVEIAPLFYQRFACTEHVNGELHDLGDALGSDCLVLGGMGAGNGFMRLYKTDGKTNEDWYGWHVEVHAPFDGVVTETATNRVTNTPGTPGKSPPSYIIFKRADGLVVVYAHLADIKVHKGDRVKVGEVVALDGNNGSAKNPHVHVGAFLGSEPLQIRWDLAAEGRIQTLAHPQPPTPAEISK